MKIFITLLIFILSCNALPREYALLKEYMASRDVNLGLRILKEYPDAVFADDLKLMLANEVTPGKIQKSTAINLLLSVNPRSLRDDLKPQLLRLWKELGLDPKVAVIKDPILFKEFIPEVRLEPEEVKKVASELQRRRMHQEAIALIERHSPAEHCYLLSRSQRALRMPQAINTLQNCQDPNAKEDLVVMLFEQGQNERALQTLALIKDENIVDNARFRIARISMQRGASSLAIEVLNEMKPSYRKEFNLGLCYFALNDYQRALDSFLKSLELSQNKEEKTAAHFWIYRCKSALGVSSASENLVKATSGSGFYQAIASKEVGVPIHNRALKAVLKDSGMPKTASLIRLIREEFPLYYRREAFKRLEELSAADIISIASFDPNLAIRLSVRRFGHGSNVYNAVAYPTPFQSFVERASQTYKIEPALIYAVMRQESLFDVRATSVANARGLMQLLDSTAQEVAKKEGIPLRDIYEPETNIMLGTAYLKWLLDQLGGDYARALAGYNAGPARARAWSYYSDTYLFIENIPFAETRDYVKKVLYNYYVYQNLLE
ncbi:MAG: transglycosylase SLT domain-containing protein [Aquificaceae bacterium]